MLWRISALPASVAVLLAIRVAATPAGSPPYCPEEPKSLERPYPPPPSPRPYAEKYKPVKPYVSPPKVYWRSPGLRTSITRLRPLQFYPEKTKSEESLTRLRLLTRRSPTSRRRRSQEDKSYKPEEKKQEDKSYKPEDNTNLKKPEDKSYKPEDRS
jgi:hypothetical protein